MLEPTFEIALDLRQLLERLRRKRARMYASAPVRRSQRQSMIIKRLTGYKFLSCRRVRGTIAMCSAALGHPLTPPVSAS